MNKIIGISGVKGSGKDYFAKMLNLENEYKIIHFAAKLKNICSTVFNHDVTDYVSSTEKEKVYTKAIYIDDYLDKLRLESGVDDIPKRGLIAFSHRQLLQYVGTEYIRSTRDNYWIDCILDIMRDDPGSKFLIPDTRFFNEIKAIQSLGGIVVMIERPDFVGDRDSHASENLGVLTNEVNLRIVTPKANELPLRMAKTCIKSNYLQNERVAIYGA